MESTFSSRRLHRFLPRAGTQLAQKQEELERNLREAVALAEEGEDGEEEEENMVVGNDLVEEVAAEVEGSRTRRGRRYDGGGHL